MCFLLIKDNFVPIDHDSDADNMIEEGGEAKDTIVDVVMLIKGSKSRKFYKEILKRNIQVK